MTSVVAHNDWLIGYMDHTDYDSSLRILSLWEFGGQGLLALLLIGYRGRDYAA